MRTIIIEKISKKDKKFLSLQNSKEFFELFFKNLYHLKNKRHIINSERVIEFGI